MKLVVSVNVLPNYIEKLTANCLRSGGLYDKNSASQYSFTSDVMYKKY